MIKGVNKRVVEITSTDHEFFEKAVLYVKAEKSCVPKEVLNEEAREYLDRIVPVKRKTVFPLAVKLSLAACGVFAVIAAVYFVVCF